jgi:hypothetical protein
MLLASIAFLLIRTTRKAKTKKSFLRIVEYQYIDHRQLF